MSLLEISNRRGKRSATAAALDKAFQGYGRSLRRLTETEADQD